MNCAPLPADDVVFGGRLDFGDELEKIGVQRAAEAFVGRDEQNTPRLHRTLHEERVERFLDAICERGEHARHDLHVGPAGRARTCCAFFIFEAATNSIALVIWRVFLTDLMRRRISRVEAIFRKGLKDLNG